MYGRGLEGQHRSAATSRLHACPRLDDSVSRGLNKPDCGLQPEGQYHCDFWNLTKACDGPAAVAGSLEMAGICSALCDSQPACTAYMVDRSSEMDSGLCFLMQGSPVLTKQCFYQSGRTGDVDPTSTVCDTSPVSQCTACDPDSIEKFVELAFRWEAADGESDARVKIKRARGSHRGSVAHGDTAHFTPNKNVRFGVNVVIKVDDQQRKFNLRCSKGVVVGHRIPFTGGDLVLAGFETENGDTAETRCDAKTRCRICDPLQTLALTSLTFTWMAKAPERSTSDVTVSAGSRTVDTTSSNGGHVGHGGSVTLTVDASTEKGSFGKTTVITVGIETRVLDTSCTTNFNLWKKLHFTDGTLVLTGFTSPTDDETTLCPANLEPECVWSSDRTSSGDGNRTEGKQNRLVVLLSVGIFIVAAASVAASRRSDRRRTATRKGKAPGTADIDTSDGGSESSDDGTPVTDEGSVHERHCPETILDWDSLHVDDTEYIEVAADGSPARRDSADGRDTIAQDE